MKQIRAKLKQAVQLVAIEGRKVGDVAERVGMHPAALSRALNKPHVKAYIEERKALVCMDADQLRGIAKAMALQVGMELLRDSKDERIRARMVEFFAGEDKKSQQIQVNIDSRPGYEFKRPGHKIVDITPPDSGPTD